MGFPDSGQSAINVGSTPSVNEHMLNTCMFRASRNSCQCLLLCPELSCSSVLSSSGVTWSEGFLVVKLKESARELCASALSDRNLSAHQIDTQVPSYRDARHTQTSYPFQHSQSALARAPTSHHVPERTSDANSSSECGSSYNSSSYNANSEYFAICHGSSVSLRRPSTINLSLHSQVVDLTSLSRRSYCSSPSLLHTAPEQLSPDADACSSAVYLTGSLPAGMQQYVGPIEGQEIPGVAFIQGSITDAH